MAWDPASWARQCADKRASRLSFKGLRAVVSEVSIRAFTAQLTMSDVSAQTAKSTLSSCSLAALTTTGRSTQRCVVGSHSLFPRLQRNA